MRRLKRCRGVFTGVCGVRFSHFSQSAFNELTYHFSAQLRKLYYFKSIMNPVAIYHFFKKYFCFLFVLLSMIKWRFQGVGRRKMAKKTLASRFQCCKECYQFAPYLAFSNFGFFQRYPNLNSATVNYQNFSTAKMRVLIWWWGLFWNLVVDFQQSKQKVKTSFLAL